MACCGKSEIDNTDIKTNDFHDHYKHLKYSDKVALIVRLQAAFRGYLARKRVYRIREQYGFHAGMQSYSP